MATTVLDLPTHFDLADAGRSDYEVPDVFGLQRGAQEWGRRHNIPLVGSDRRNVHLLIIDGQRDFVYPDGTLYVAKAEGDVGRIAEFVYRNLATISRITCTLDTHVPYQVFFPSAHVRPDGSNPDIHTVVSEEDYATGKLLASPIMAAQLGVDQAWLTRQWLHYCRELKRVNKLDLTIWPYHCLLGSPGHRLAGVIDAARLFHGFVRGALNPLEVKGGNPLTENYSVLAPEVMTLWDGRAIPGAQRNTSLFETLLRSDVVIIVGEAASHCVAWSIKDLLTQILPIDKTLPEKVYIPWDCTKPVIVPGVVDYTAQAEAARAEFENAGMHIVNSTDPIESWPGIQL